MTDVNVVLFFRSQFSSDNASLLTASDDKTVKIWSIEVLELHSCSLIILKSNFAVQEQKFRHTLHGHTNWVRSASMR